MTDQRYLVTDQYKNTANLAARHEFYARFTTSPVNWFEWVFSQFDFPENANLLEIGCGNGELWRQNQTRIPSSWHLTLGDLSLQMVRQAARTLTFLQQQAQFQVLDAQLLKYDNDLFDGVIANHVLYHVPNPNRAILESHRVLKAKGTFYAATNGIDHLRELHDLIADYPPVADQLTPRNLADRYSFNLQNGEELLRKYFSRVKLQIYSDGVIVDNPEPIVAYTFSLLPKSGSRISEPEKEGFRAHIQSHIDHFGGKLHIQTSTGMFIAEKSTRATR